jgi:dolichyl-phosphate beta-glucosyltransferase
VKGPEISVVIPAYNEADRLPATLARLGAFLTDRREASEVIVVADGSTDETVAIAAAAARHMPCPLSVRAQPGNRGKGHCVAQGVRLAAGRRILMTDADLSTPLEELDRLTPWLDRGYAVAIGSRHLRGEGTRVGRKARRALTGWVFALLTSRLVLPGIRDTQCGFKLFEADAARSIFARLTVERFAFDVEVLVIATALGYRVAEVPVSWREDPQSTVRLARDASSMVRDLLRIRRRLLAGAYAVTSHPTDRL